MRYPPSEKLEIIRLVEQSRLPVRRTLEHLGLPRSTFYRWYDQYQTGGPEALEEAELSPRELAVRFTDTKGYFVSEASVYRLLKAHNLITSPAFIVIKAADEFTVSGIRSYETDCGYNLEEDFGLIAVTKERR